METYVEAARTPSFPHRPNNRRSFTIATMKKRENEPILRPARLTVRNNELAIGRAVRSRKMLSSHMLPLLPDFGAHPNGGPTGPFAAMKNEKTNPFRQCPAPRPRPSAPGARSRPAHNAYP